MGLLISVLDDFISLFYPKLCSACSKSLLKHEECICTSCLVHLPKTNFHKEIDNPASKIFWGRVAIDSVTAYYYFNKGGKIQSLIHKLKYRGNQEIGIYIGKLMGNELIRSEHFNKVNVVIPVPLHLKKKKKRGYNQSQLIAEGISFSMKIAHDYQSLYRKSFSESQTRKSRFKRWENVKEIFDVKNPDQLSGKHILLVDDVITTGATIEACASELLKIPGVKVSVAAIACAYH